MARDTLRVVDMVVEGLIVELDGVVTLLEALLELLDLELEALFLFFVLGFQS